MERELRGTLFFEGEGEGEEREHREGEGEGEGEGEERVRRLRGRLLVLQQEGQFAGRCIQGHGEGLGRKIVSLLI